MITKMEFGGLLESISRGAGDILKGIYGTGFKVEHKGEIDLVTEADKRCEEYILEELSRHDPGTRILSEEFHSDYDRPLSGGHPGIQGDLWVIDPLDGTTNFAHGFPWFAISICKIERGSPVCGAVYLPIQDELFIAEKGKGAYLKVATGDGPGSSARIHVSGEHDLTRALFATGFPYDVHHAAETVVAALKAMLVRTQGIRRAGAAAIDMVYVACGRLDGFWEQKLKPWDTAAGMLILEEAGGRTTTFTLDPYNPFIPEVLATNGLVHQAASKILAPFTICGAAEPGRENHPRNPVPTVDVIIRLDGIAQRIVLIERKNPPHGWALPGGFVDYGESLEDAARREALEETGLEVNLRGQLGTYSDPGRDSRLHTISTVFIADAAGEPRGADDARCARVFSLDALPTPLCFDHQQILDDYRKYLESASPSCFATPHQHVR